VFYDRFLEFQQKVLERRRRHRLDNNTQLLEKQNKQSKLNNWIKYQNYELRKYEHLEKNFKKAQARLAFRRQTLAKTEISVFEEIEKLEFVSYYSLAVQCSNEKEKAKKRKKLTKRKLRLTEKKLKIVESSNLKKRVEKTTWIVLFLKEIESAQMQLNELQRLTENTKRELELYNR